MVSDFRNHVFRNCHCLMVPSVARIRVPGKFSCCEKEMQDCVRTLSHTKHILHLPIWQFP